MLTENWCHWCVANPAGEERLEKGGELGRLRRKPPSPVARRVKSRVTSGSSLLTRTLRMREAITQKEAMTATHNTASTSPNCVSSPFTA